MGTRASASIALLCLGLASLSCALWAADSCDPAEVARLLTAGTLGPHVRLEKYSAEAKLLLAKLVRNVSMGTKADTLATVMKKSDPELARLDTPVRPAFEYTHPTVPFVIRYQPADAQALSFFMNHGFHSRAHGMAIPDIKELETQAAASKEVLAPFVTQQKAGYDAGFPTFMVEASSSGEFVREKLGSAVASTATAPMIFSRLKAERAIPVAPNFFEFDREGGQLFLGNVTPAEVIDFLYKDATGQWTRFSRAEDGAWIGAPVTDVLQIINYARELPEYEVPRKDALIEASNMLAAAERIQGLSAADAESFFRANLFLIPDIQAREAFVALTSGGKLKPAWIGALRNPRRAKEAEILEAVLSKITKTQSAVVFCDDYPFEIHDPVLRARIQFIPALTKDLLPAQLEAGRIYLVTARTLTPPAWAYLVRTGNLKFAEP